MTEDDLTEAKSLAAEMSLEDVRKVTIPSTSHDEQ